MVAVPVMTVLVAHIVHVWVELPGIRWARNFRPVKPVLLTPPRRLKSMKYKENSPEVLVADEEIVKVARPDIDFLKARVPATLHRRARFCAHKSGGDAIHEMLIVLSRGTYIRPHKHLAKSESFHVIEGAVDVVIFDEAGAVSEVVRMGDYASGKNFYYRLAHPAYHTLILRTENLVIHETTNGPFRREETIFAPWSPVETDVAAAEAFMKKLSASVAASA